MRRSLAGLLAALLFISVAARARADVQVQKVSVQPQGYGASVSVDILNPGTDRQKGPVVVQMYVRKGVPANFTLVRTWKDIDFIQGGESVSRTWYNDSSNQMHALVKRGQFDIKIRVTAPGLPAPVEYHQTWKAGSGGL